MMAIILHGAGGNGNAPAAMAPAADSGSIGIARRCVAPQCAAHAPSMTATPDPSAPAQVASEPLLLQAFACHQGGQWQEAARLYRAVIAAEPRHADAHHGYGTLALQAQQPAAALPHLKLALEANPDHGQYWQGYIEALAAAGLRDAAAAMLTQGIGRGLAGAAVDALAAQLLPRAAARPATATAIEPPRAELDRLAALFAQQRHAEMEAAAQLLTMRYPHSGEAWKALGSARLFTAGGDAVEALRLAARRLPGDAALQANLGSALLGQQRFAEAETPLRRAVEIDPGFVEARSNLGLVLMSLGRFADAEACFRRAVEQAPKAAKAHNNLGMALKEQGRLEPAEQAFRAALDVEPDYAVAWSNLLLTMNYGARHSPAFCLSEARAFGAMLTRTTPPQPAGWTCANDATRLRVGLLSGDLGNHPVGYFLDALLTHVDPASVEFYAYPTMARDDALSRRLRARCAGWTPIAGQTDDAAAQRIRADGIQILLDLSGHTAYNRLPLLARRPAPVQATWLGYFATTGVAEIDYFIADPVGVPPEHGAHFSETIRRLPRTRLCFSPPPDAPPVAPSPGRQHGFVTFGCFQNLAKVGDAVLHCWAQILDACPDARLRLQSPQLSHAEVRAQLAARLAQHGMDGARVALHGATSRDAYLAAHAEVDVILDTFPFPGGTTTCEALWMGVPTLTLNGDRLISRQGASLLTAAGLPDWIAADTDDYVRRAIALAGRPDQLQTWRESLRDRVAASALFDGVAFARDFTDALHGMWQEKASGMR